MTNASTIRLLLTTTALGALIGVSPILSAAGWAADPPSQRMQSQQQSSKQPSPTTMAHQQTALAALAEAHNATRRGDAGTALDRIERAETALLNLEQTQPDPRVEHSLLRLDLARSAINRKDTRVADELIASTAHSLTGAFAVAAANMPPGTSPVSDSVRSDQVRASRWLGEPIYDANDQALGNVIDLVLDPDGTVDAIVIGMPAPGGGVVGKDVAVPMSAVHGGTKGPTVDHTRDQLQQASNYQLNPAASSGGSGVGASTGSGATGAGASTRSGSVVTPGMDPTKPPPEDDPSWKYRPGHH